MADKLSIAIAAEIAEFERRMSMLPDVGGKQARELSKQINRELKKAEDGAGSSFGNMGKMVGELGKKVGEGLGLPMESFGIVAGGAGIAVAGVGLAFVGAIAGSFALAEGALAARDRLEEAGLAARIPPEAQHALDKYQGATGRLWQEVDVLVTKLGAALAPVLTIIVDSIADVIEWVSSLNVSFQSVREGIQGFMDMLPEWARWEPAVHMVTGAVDLLEGAWGAVIETADAAEVAQVKKAESTAVAVRKVAAEVQKVDKYMLKFSQDVQDHFRTDIAEGMGFFHEQILDTQVAIEKTHRSTNQWLNDMQDKLDQTFSSLDKWMDNVQGATDLIIDGYKRQEEAGKKLTEAQERAANTAFRIGQTAAIAQITFSLAAAFAALLASQAYLGPGAILAASAEVGAAAIAIGAILGQTPPYPQGGPTAADPYTIDDVKSGQEQPNVDAKGGSIDKPDRRNQRTTGPSEVMITVDPALQQLVVVSGRAGKRRFY